jgi:hypothetical protein
VQCVMEGRPTRRCGVSVGDATVWGEDKAGGGIDDNVFRKKVE